MFRDRVELPKAETLEQLTKKPFVTENEPPDFHYNRMRNRYVDTKLKEAVNDAGKLLEGPQRAIFLLRALTKTASTALRTSVALAAT